MKRYKVGDTIWSRDIVVDVDYGETDQMYRTRGNGWIHNYTVVDGEPKEEPVKPVLPKNVADEMEDYKATGFDLVDYFSAFNECADDVKNSSKYAYDNTDEINNQRVANLANAWNNGYTVEKPKLYNLVLGKNMWGWPLALYKPTGNDNNLIAYPDAAPKYLRDSVYQFTQEEIDKYNKGFWIKDLDLNDYKVEVRTDDSED